MRTRRIRPFTLFANLIRIANFVSRIVHRSSWIRRDMLNFDAYYTRRACLLPIANRAPRLIRLHHATLPTRFGQADATRLNRSNMSGETICRVNDACTPVYLLRVPKDAVNRDCPRQLTRCPDRQIGNLDACTLRPRTANVRLD